MRTLQGLGIDTSGLYSKGSDAFADTPPDVVITVCDKADGEPCPVYFCPAIKSHWGLSDPSEVDSTDQDVQAAFNATVEHIKRRFAALFTLDLRTLQGADLKHALDRSPMMSEFDTDFADIFPALDLSLIDLPIPEKLGLSDGANIKSRILLLYGSTRERSFSRLLNHEAAHLLQHMGAETVIFDPSRLPLPDDTPVDHPKVQELRDLVLWSDGQVGAPRNVTVRCQRWSKR